MFADLIVPTAAVAQNLRINAVARAEGQSGSKTVLFKVSLARANSTAMTVRYATANSTAQAGRDYVATSAVLTFLAGQLARTVSVAVRGDRVKEGNETFYLTLSGQSGATILDGQGGGRLGMMIRGRGGG